jgi:hypothetical protein
MFTMEIQQDSGITKQVKPYIDCDSCHNVIEDSSKAVVDCFNITLKHQAPVLKVYHKHCCKWVAEQPSGFRGWMQLDEYLKCLAEGLKESAKEKKARDLQAA